MTRQRPSGSSSPAARPWCGPGPPGGKDVAPGDPSSGRAGRAAQSSLVPRVRPGPTPGLDARNSWTAGGNPAPSADGDTRPFSAERGKQEKVEPGQRARHRYSPCRELYPRRTKRSDRLTVSRNTARPRHAHGDLTSLAPHERLPEILVVPREKTPTGAAARGNP